MDIHLDPLGGWSGDMFVAALLDAFPEHWPRVQATIASLNLGAEANAGWRRIGITRSREAGSWSGRNRPNPARDIMERTVPGLIHIPTMGAATAHRAWSDIRDALTRSSLDFGVKAHAVAIFELLADAEAAIHGVKPEDATFHEVGAVDSIVDIVAAAQLLALIDADRWTSAPLPIGSGRVNSAHGILPVPAPATALLIRGLPVIDDGIPGERVTPTGAALARYLVDPHAPPDLRPRRLSRSGVGFGARTLPGISNCLRSLAFEIAEKASATPANPILRRQLAVIAFEVDDQSAEDLATGLDHIRAVTGVLDVTQSSVVGKKGRMAARIQVLVAPAELESAIVVCFEETTTIGLRYNLTEGAILRRHLQAIEIEGETLQVKVVDRPGGTRSGKTEAADAASRSGHFARAWLRREAEARALAPSVAKDQATGDC